MALKQQEQAIVNLVINGQQAQSSLREVSGVVNALRADLNRMHEADNPALYQQRVRELQRMTAAQSAMREQINGGSQALRRFRQDMMATAAGVFGGNIFTFLGEQAANFIPNLINKAADLSDVMSDIQKTTGLTATETKNLVSEIGKIDTRTKSKELKEIAINAGQLGVAKEDVLGFVSSIDKVNVALGDEFQGGAGEVSDTIGKIRNVFSDIKTDRIDSDILKIGNALNELGADGMATAPVVSDFANRIGGAGIQLGLTSGQVLGLSATLQELNVNTERGSTAVVDILQKMLTNTESFAAVAGMSVKDFKTLLDKDLYGAFTRVVAGAGSSSESATKFASILDKLKIDGVGATEVISKLSANTEMLEGKVNLASEALKGTGSIMNEFNLKNNNLAANVEKLGKKMSNIFSTMTSPISNFFSNLIGKMVDTQTESDRLNSVFEEQSSIYNRLNGRVSPLLSRYDQLKSKAKLNKEEQTELKKAINSVAEAIPSAVTGYDKLGNALGINTEKAREFLKMQQAVLQYQNRDAIAATREEIKKQEYFRDEETKMLNNALKNVIPNEKLIANLRAGVANRSQILNSTLYPRLKALKGGLLEDAGKPEKQDSSSTIPTVTPLAIESDEEKNKREQQAKRALAEFAQLNEDYRKLGIDRLHDTLSANEKEIAAEEQKYNELILKEKAFLQLKGTTADQRKAIETQISNLEKEKGEAVKNLRIKQEQDLLQKISELRTSLADVHETELQKQKDQINKFYDAREKENAGNEKVLADLRIARAKDLTDAEIREKERLEKEKQRIDSEYSLVDGNKHAVKINEINAKYDQEIEALKQKYSKELQATQEFQDALDKINGKRNQEIKEQTELDEEDKKDLILKAAQETSDSVFQIMSNNRAAETQEKLSRLEKERDAELSNKNLSEAQKKRINDKYDRQIRAEKLRAWRADQRAAFGQAVINTALAVTKALPNIPLSIAAGIAGAAQMAVILGEKPPQYAKGVRNAKKGLAIVSEEGSELIEENGKYRLTGTNGPELTYLEDGANVYTATDTAKILSGETTTPVSIDALSSMNSTSRGISFNQEAFSQGVERFRYGTASGSMQSQEGNRTVSTTLPPIINQFDTGSLESKMDQFIEVAQEAWNMHLFMKKMKDYQKIEDDSKA